MSAPRKHQLKRGDRFGRLRLIREVRSGYNIAWVCRCDCGTQKTIQQSNLIAKRSQSCGCLGRERGRENGKRNRRHGDTYSPTWTTWQAMLRRCYSKSSKDYPRYGAKGVRVCRRWRHYENFLSDMGPRPVGHTIDRFPDRDGNYEPGNCRWATPKQQSNNCRTNVRLTVHGESFTLTEWSRRLGLHRDTVRARIRRGWGAERAVGRG
jgi:hypothetical protein